MANRQYVGARYVPKFYQGTNGNEWDSGVAYEALTVVTYLNNSYTSKKPIPARTITPNLDTEYWALTGNYNGMIGQLDNKIDNVEEELNTKITNVENSLDISTFLSGTIVLIGDSYLAGYTPGGDITSWGTYLKNKLNKDDVYSFYKSGSGFCNTVDGENFITLITTASQEEEIDNSKVTLVLFGGGYNDFGYSVEQKRTAINNAITSVNTNFPNAKSIFAFMPWDMGSNAMTLFNKLDNLERYFDAIKDTEMIFLSNIYTVLQNNKSYFANDLKHPNSDGQKAIASAIISALYDNYNGTIYNLKEANNYSNTFLCGDEKTLMLLIYSNLNIVISPSMSINCNGYNKLCDIDLITEGFDITNNTDFIRFTLNGFIKSGGKYYDMKFSCKIKNGKLEFYPYAINSENTNYLTLSDCTDVQIFSTSVILPKLFM